MVRIRSGERHETIARMSHDYRANVLNHSQLKSPGNLIANGPRRVRDGFETLAMTLRLFGEGFCRIDFLNMFEIFANCLRLFATQARKLRIIATVSRPL